MGSSARWLVGALGLMLGAAVASCQQAPDYVASVAQITAEAGTDSGPKPMDAGTRPPDAGDMCPQITGTYLALSMITKDPNCEIPVDPNLPIWPFIFAYVGDAGMPSRAGETRPLSTCDAIPGQPGGCCYRSMASNQTFLCPFYCDAAKTWLKMHADENARCIFKQAGPH
jgi:hypothetical protein